MTLSEITAVSVQYRVCIQIECRTWLCTVFHNADKNVVLADDESVDDVVDKSLDGVPRSTRGRTAAYLKRTVDHEHDVGTCKRAECCHWKVDKNTVSYCYTILDDKQLYVSQIPYYWCSNKQNVNYINAAKSPVVNQ